MKKFTFLLASFVLLFSAVSYFTFTISRDLDDYHDKKQEIAKTLNFEDRLLNVWEWVPFNTEGDKKVEKWQQLEQEASHLYGKAKLMGLILAAFVLAFILSNVLFYFKKPHKLQIYGLVMVFSALSFLYLGLQSPFMELEVYSKDLALKIPLDIDTEEIPFISELGFGKQHYDFDQVFKGRMYYFYQNKSIVGLISILYTGGNFLVAVLLIFFSIVFPLIKLFSSIIVLMNPTSKNGKKFVPIITYLGKWSMPDVFVVSIFLAVFSVTNMNVGVDTASATLIGTYFFLAFVLLSIFSGFVLKKVVHSKSDSALDYI